VPFNDPEDVYSDIRLKIETVAQSLGMKLHKLNEEATSPAFLTNIHLSKEGKSIFCYYA